MVEYLHKEELIRINHLMTSYFGGLFLEPHNLQNDGALDYIIEMAQQIWNVQLTEQTAKVSTGSKTFSPPLPEAHECLISVAK